VEGGVHATLRRDARLRVAIAAESLRVVARLAVGIAAEQVDGVSFHEVGTMEGARIGGRVTRCARLRRMTKRALQASSGGEFSVLGGDISGMDRARHARRAHPKP